MNEQYISLFLVVAFAVVYITVFRRWSREKLARAEAEMTHTAKLLGGTYEDGMICFEWDEKPGWIRRGRGNQSRTRASKWLELSYDVGRGVAGGIWLQSIHRRTSPRGTDFDTLFALRGDRQGLSLLFTEPARRAIVALSEDGERPITIQLHRGRLVLREYDTEDIRRFTGQVKAVLESTHEALLSMRVVPVPRRWLRRLAGPSWLGPVLGLVGLVLLLAAAVLTGRSQGAALLLGFGSLMLGMILAFVAQYASPSN